MEVRLDSASTVVGIESWQEPLPSLPDSWSCCICCLGHLWLPRLCLAAAAYVQIPLGLQPNSSRLPHPLQALMRVVGNSVPVWGDHCNPRTQRSTPPRAGTSKFWWNRSIYIHGPLSVMHYPAHNLYALLLWKGVFIFEDFYNQVAQTGWLRQKLSHSSGGHKTEKDPMMLFWVQKPPCVPCL